MTERPKVQPQDVAAVQTADFIAGLLVGLVTSVVSIVRFVITVLIVLGKRVSVFICDPRLRSALVSFARHTLLFTQTLIEQFRQLKLRNPLTSITPSTSDPRNVGPSAEVEPILGPPPTAPPPPTPVHVPPPLPPAEPAPGPAVVPEHEAEENHGDGFVIAELPVPPTPPVIQVPIAATANSEPVGYGVALFDPDTGTPGNWFAVIVGRSVGVFQQWTNVGPMVTGVSSACFAHGPSRAQAFAKFRAANERGQVRIVP